MSAIASEVDDAERPRILIVEDERIVALDLAATLDELGYEVAGVASRSDEAIERSRQSQPDLILMDVRLSGPLDGIGTAEIIRKQRDVPIVYLTAHSDSETLRRAAESSASGYVVKPFKSPELRCAIEIALHKHALDAHQMGFASGELVAHVNYMLVEGRLTGEEVGGVLRFRTT